jgi:hypothetical protein
MRFALRPGVPQSACVSSGSRTTDRPEWRRRLRSRLSPRTPRVSAQRERTGGLSPASTRRPRASRREPSRSSEVMRGECARLLELLPGQIRELRQRSCERPRRTRLNDAQVGARRDAKALKLLGRNASIRSDHQIVVRRLARSRCTHGFSLPSRGALKAVNVALAPRHRAYTAEPAACSRNAPELDGPLLPKCSRPKPDPRSEVPSDPWNPA